MGTFGLGKGILHNYILRIVFKKKVISVKNNTQLPQNNPEIPKYLLLSCV